MNYPIITFKRSSLALEIDYIYGFLFNGAWGWGKYIIRRHPKLRPVLESSKPSERERFLKQYISSYYQQHAELITIKEGAHIKSWNKVDREYFTLISRILNMPWPKRNITALLSINPICPRMLGTWSFTYYYNYSILRVREVIMHECLHFLYFEKWCQLFPNIPTSHYETPYLEWHLSEMIAPIVLNDSRVQKILRRKANFYQEHQTIRINGISAPDYFTTIYNKLIKKPDGFDGFVRESYRIMKRHKQLWKRSSRA